MQKHKGVTTQKYWHYFNSDDKSRAEVVSFLIFISGGEEGVKTFFLIQKFIQWKEIRIMICGYARGSTNGQQK